MCGIASIIKRNPLEDSATCDIETRLLAMIDSFAHRGPDGIGVYTEPHRVGLGMNRLAIVGAEFGNQPIWNEDHTVAIVCNGEIYNYLYLRTTLEAEGHVFSSSSDVEVIIHLYESMGEQCVALLEGIFAFALWDATRSKLLVARDRLGVKPLYFTETKDDITFASELRALLVISQQPTEIDRKAFHAFNIYRYVPAPETMVHGMKKLAPGQYMVVENGSVTKRFYWDPPSIHGTPDFQSDNHVRDLQRHVFHAVKSQVAQDVKSGILLSGGLDSTLLLSVYAKVSGAVPETFTVSFDKPKEHAAPTEYSEIEYAKSVAAQFESRHYSECYSAREVLDFLPIIVAAIDEPIADPTAIPLWFATRMAHQSNVKVLYSGEGLDELFSGYSVYHQIRWIKRLHYVPPQVRNMVISFLSKSGLPGAGILRRASSPAWMWYQGVGGLFTPRELGDLVTPKYAMEDVQDVQSYAERQIQPVNSESILTQMTHFDVRSWLPENTLVKSDKISMSHSVELRVPFLDRSIVEFALQLGDTEKLRGTVGKWIVRQVARELVPESILKRPKTGFPVPITAWIFGEWKDYVLSMLLSPHSCIREMYKPSMIEQLYKMKDAQRAGRMLWALLTFELWYQHVYRFNTLMTHAMTAHD